MGANADIVIRNAHGTEAGRISRGPDGALAVVVLDEASRWLVEVAAERAGAPLRPRPRPSCAAPGTDGPGPASAR